MNPANVETSRASKVAKILCSWSETSVRLMSWSPRLHAAIDDEVDASYVRALVGGEEQRDVRDLLGLTEATHERFAEHLAGPLRVAELIQRRVAFEQARRDRVGADPG